jgi:hypothetical protein
MANGWTAISIREEIKSRLEEIYKRDRKRPQNQKFSAWFDNMLEGLVDYDEKLERYGALLETESLSDHSIILMDKMIGKHVFIVVDPLRKDKPLYCEKDLSTDCIHVGYCMALPELYKLLIDHGLRPNPLLGRKVKENEVKSSISRNLDMYSTHLNSIDAKTKFFEVLQKNFKGLELDTGDSLKARFALIYGSLFGTDPESYLQDEQRMKNFIKQDPEQLYTLYEKKKMTDWQRDIDKLEKNLKKQSARH